MTRRWRAWWLLLMGALGLCAACGVWVHVQQQQYARNRQLIEALLKEDTRQALPLVNAGADPNTRYLPTPAPSLLALVQQFLHRKPPPDNDSPTAFQLTCGIGYDVPNGNFAFSLHVPDRVKLAQAMLAHGADMYANYSGHANILTGATDVNDTALADLLLAHGANLNAPTWGGITPLMWSCLMHSSKMADYFLAHGANPNLQDIDGDTALHYALTCKMSIDCIVQLLTHRANPTLPNKKGVTPLMLAQQVKRSDLARLLKRRTK